MNTKLTFIGYVRSPLKERDQAPKQGTSDAPKATIKILKSYLPALSRLRPGQEVLILTWLHLADRKVLQCHPRGDSSRPLHGVFATRSPDRPNPIGIHPVRLLSIEEDLLTVHPLEALDGTPVLDIKPVLAPSSDRTSPSDEERIIRAARDGWFRGILSGFNGNLSIRREDSSVLITASGTAKGFLSPEDLCLVDLPSGRHLAGSAPSSETQMHLEIYRRQPKAFSIVHTHPPSLLAVSLQGRPLLPESLFEARAYAEQFTSIPPLPPGSLDLAQSVAEAAWTHRAVFMQHHGLTCWGANPAEALALSEELESLASIQLRISS
ncbi:MAG: tRNA (N6-threonylcarbamoyladenosine(37)-N6)-methyltransferase TrmO [Desulfovibrionales bacterium]